MKRHAPATVRNREPISAILAEELPDAGLVLEIASGSGEHVVHFARTFPSLDWQPSDPDPAALQSIAAWREESDLGNLRLPLQLDVTAPRWPLGRADAIVCCNMIHISPPAAAEGLLAGAEAIMAGDGPLVIYGPFLEAGVETAPSNLAFDADLKTRNAQWGLRDLAWVDGLAQRHGLMRTRRVQMPANNLIVVFRRVH